MKNLKEKLRKNGGFTLVEMLIVVAIIAILIAVSIPMVGSALERSRHAVDQANIRDAAALGAIEYLTNEPFKGKDATVTHVEYRYYVNDAHQGTLVATDKTAEARYTQVKCSCTCANHPADTAVLTVKIDKNGNVFTNWGSDGEGKTIMNTNYPGYTAPAG